jgi:peroxiredoxin
MPELRGGDPVSDFSLAPSGGGTLVLHDLCGSRVAVYSYLNDDSRARYCSAARPRPLQPSSQVGSSLPCVA